MLDDSRARHIEALLDLLERELLVCEQAEHAPPRRIRHRSQQPATPVPRQGRISPPASRHVGRSLGNHPVTCQFGFWMLCAERAAPTFGGRARATLTFN